MRAAIIVNPISGVRARREIARADLAMRWVRAAGLEAEIVATTCRGHAAELAASLAAAGYERVVAWGGDGTINEAAGPLIGTPTALGIIPGGSGDGLARSLGLPRDPERALKVALTGRSRAIDVAWLAGRHFLNIAGVGFDAEVGVRFNRRKRRGTWGYVLETLGTIWTYRCESYRVSLLPIDSGGFEGPSLPLQEFDGPRFVIAFANGREYGNGLKISPDSDPGDGRLDAVVVAGGGPLRQAWRARRLFWRRTAAAEGIIRLPVAGGTVRGERLVCHVDGETFEERGEISLRMQAGALGVIAAEG